MTFPKEVQSKTQSVARVTNFPAILQSQLQRKTKTF